MPGPLVWAMSISCTWDEIGAWLLGRVMASKWPSWSAIM